MKRAYDKARRSAASDEARQRAAQAAWRVIAHASSVEEISTERIAKQASVSRMTLFNLLGDKRACIAAGFAHFAREHAMEDLVSSLDENSAHAAALQYCAAFVCFYFQHRITLARLRGYAAHDADIAKTLLAREVRREIGVSYLFAQRAIELGVTPRSESQRRDIRHLCALLGFDFVNALRAAYGSERRTAGALTAILLGQMDALLSGGGKAGSAG